MDQCFVVISQQDSLLKLQYEYIVVMYFCPFAVICLDFRALVGFDNVYRPLQ